MILINFYFFQIFIKYSRLIEKFVNGHLDNAEIETDKLATPFSQIKLFL
jgi:hypothetical protein